MKVNFIYKIDKESQESIQTFHLPVPPQIGSNVCLLIAGTDKTLLFEVRNVLLECLKIYEDELVTAQVRLGLPIQQSS